jgi:hypothetical protein
MLTRFVSALILSAAPATLLAQPTQQPARTEVPVKTVVLFSSGVGYFEHAGTVRGDGATELRFKTGQINDILKSLVLQDLDGGKVTTITYPSQDPISKTLRSFQVDITSNPTLADLLTQLRGAKVTIQSQAEKLTGTILGVESRRKPVERGEPVELSILNMLTGATIRAVDLETITSLTLDDPQLQDELTKALAALSQARDQDKKPVTINFSGSGDRRVRIGYVVETPVWKTSYRLLLDDKTSRLQGWAIVENQTESDWTNVQLSLVSGRPISFVMDLYQPLYATRPLVVPELFAGLRPQVYDGGIDARGERVAMSTTASGAASPPQGQQGQQGPAGAGGGGRGGRGGGGAAAAVAGGIGRGAAAPDQAFERVDAFSARTAAEMASSVQSAAQAARMGELFQYTVGNVTLARQKSAMIPIITDSVGIDRVSIYNASVLQSNPLNGVRLKNTTGKHLLQGPITVLDKSSYAGDARIDNVPPGQERLLSYGIDLEMVVDNTKNTQTSAVVTGKINKGLLIIDRRYIASQEYLADNKGDKDKMLVIEHPIRQGWKLLDTQKPIETTQSLYRFQGNAPTKKVTTLTVKEEIVRSEQLAMLPSDIGTLLVYSRTGEIPGPVRDAIAKAIQYKQALIDLERQINDKTKQIADITQEQDRIRENMKTVGQTTQYYERLLAKLNEQESSIEKLQGDRDALMVKRDAQRKELEDYVSTLTIG